MALLHRTATSTQSRTLFTSLTPIARPWCQSMTLTRHRGLSTSSTLLADRPRVETPKVSKYRVDGQSPKHIKRKGEPRNYGKAESKAESRKILDWSTKPKPEEHSVSSSSPSSSYSRATTSSSPRNNYRVHTAVVRGMLGTEDDPFDRILPRDQDKDAGKFGRSSFPARDERRDEWRSRNSNESDRRSSRFNDNSRSSYSSSSSRSITGERSYDASLSRTSISPSQRMNEDHDYLYSPNVVLPALHNKMRTPYKLYYTHTLIQNRKKRKDDPVADCIEAARLASVPIVKTDKHQLNEMAGQRPHQGVVLEASKLQESFATGLGAVDVDNAYHLQRKSSDVAFQPKADEPPVWIALDEVVDPQNLGAILRTSMFMGVDGVIVCHKNSAPLSAVVAKASAGALEVRPTYGVTSLMKFIKNSQANGWHVVGAHVTYGSKRNRPIHQWPETGVDQPTLLIMGSEGNGLRKQIMNQCDSFIQIPCLSTIKSNVDSLNVSVATGVILSKLMGGRFLHLPQNLKKFPLRDSDGFSGQEGREVGVGTGGDDEDHDDEDVDDDEDDDEEEEEEKEVKKPVVKSTSSKTLPW
ncbi:hypothetical protein CPB97_000216 [Podila verticillata]|nr:hypothetical protein CPB97_000216 [Podila verticillata]